MAPDTLEGLDSDELQPQLDQRDTENREAGRTEGGRQLFCNHENQPWEPVSFSVFTAPSAHLQVPSYLSRGCVADTRGTDKAHGSHLPTISTNRACNPSWGLSVEKSEILCQSLWGAVTVYAAG